MALWTPANLTSCTLEGWYRVRDPAGVVALAADVYSGSAVTNWTDRSGNGRTLVKIAPPGHGAPVYNANGLASGYPTVGPSFVTAGGMAYPSGQPLSVFAIGIETAGGGNYRRLASFNASGSADYSPNGVVPLITDASGSGTILYYQNGNTSSKAYTANTPVLFEGYALSSTTAIAAINAVLAGASTSVAFTGLSMDKFALMDQSDSPGGSYSWTGSVAEAILIAGIPSSAEVAKLEGYITWNNGQQALLSSGHAYYTAPPTLPGFSPPIFRRPLRMFTRRF